MIFEGPSKQNVSNCISYVNVTLYNEKNENSKIVIAKQAINAETIHNAKNKIKTIVVLSQDFLKQLKYYKFEIKFKKYKNLLKTKQELETVIIKCSEFNTFSQVSKQLEIKDFNITVIALVRQAFNKNEKTLVSRKRITIHEYFKPFDQWLPLYLEDENLDSNSVLEPIKI